MGELWVQGSFGLRRDRGVSVVAEMLGWLRGDTVTLLDSGPLCFTES